MLGRGGVTYGAGADRVKLVERLDLSRSVESWALIKQSPCQRLTSSCSGTILCPRRVREGPGGSKESLGGSQRGPGRDIEGSWVSTWSVCSL